MKLKGIAFDRRPIRQIAAQMLSLSLSITLMCLAALNVEGATLSVKVSGLAGDPVTDAVVYAVPKSGKRVTARTPRPAVIEQKDREFAPFVAVVQVGATVSFPNRDPLLHHVYSFSPAKSFEIKLYSGDAARGIVFDKPGTVTLGCNIHDWMLGYIQVVDTPFFGVTGPDGRAAIGDMVAGEFEVHVWHPNQRASINAAPARMDGRANIELAMALDVAPRKKRFKPPLDGIRYK